MRWRRLYAGREKRWTTGAEIEAAEHRGPHAQWQVVGDIQSTWQLKLVRSNQAALQQTDLTLRSRTATATATATDAVAPTSGPTSSRAR